MINIDFNNGTLEDFTVVLSDRSHFHKGQIINIEDFVYKANFNSANEISFTIYKEADGRKERLWNDITDFRLVWIKELDEYFEIYVNISESSNLIKKVTGTSLCEAELSQTLLRDVEINSESDIAREDYVITKFYNPDNPKGSLLHRVLEKVPHYYIKHVDASLVNIQRTFSIDNASIYDFLVGDCAEQFNCLFQFDSIDRSISVYDLYTVCVDCGHRGEFNDTCPKCNSTKLKYYGEDTTILVSTDNLTDEITFETDVDSVKNCFRLVAGDDNMTAAVIACNPNGSAYWYYFSQEQKLGMPKELVEKIESYDELIELYSEEYQFISEELYDCIDNEIYYRSEMMPTIEIAEVTASTEAAKLTEENMSPIGLTTVTSYTSTATVNSALKNLASIFVKTGFVKVEVDTGNFVYVGKDAEGYNYGTWTGRFKVTNYSDEEDIAYSDIITIKVTDDYNYYLVQKIQKNIASNDSDDESLYDVLSITNLDTFKEALTYYCYNRLESFADAIQGVLNILIEENQSGTDAKYYNEFYLPYYYKLTACQDEMYVRAITIEEYENRETELIKQRNEIQSVLNFEKYLGEELYTLFCSYRREDTYQNDNFISDGLDNAEIFVNALEFIELAKQEIVKSGEHQHSISSNLYNLLAMEEFAPIKDKFYLGNWIRCKVDDSIYRLRLISYEINGKSLSSINTEFSDMTKVSSGIVDFKSILDSAQSMATTYQYVSKQASHGSSAQNTLKNFESDGLNSALINIKNNVRGDITFDNNGILSRSYDDIADDFSSEQLRITHNILAFTDDNWKSVTLGLGKHSYYKYVDGVLIKDTGYGLSAKFLNSPYIHGGQIIGGEIYSENYSPTSGTHINLNDGTFSFAGGKITYDGSDLVFSGVSMTWQDITNAPTKISAFENDANYANKNYVDTAESNAKANTDEKLKSYSTTTQMNSAITAKADEINLSVSKTYSTKQELETTKDDVLKTSANDATTKANQAESNAKADTTEKLKSYSTTTQMNSAIQLSAQAINLEVSKKVGNDEVISKINQTAETITISANKIDVDGVLNVEKLNALKITAGSVAAENITGTTITGKKIIGGSINISDKFKVDSKGEATINGTISCEGIANDGYPYLASLRSARLWFSTWGLTNPETTENGWLEVGHLSIIGGDGTYPTVNNLNAGIAMITNGNCVGLGQVHKTEEDTADIYYYMNFGVNPNGCTERHLFRGASRFFNTMHCTDINLMPSNTETDISKFASFYVGTYGSGDNGVYVGGGSGLYVFGDIGCSGTKHRVVDTEHYGKVGMNAFETPEPYFADIGSGTISEIGSTTIFIDPIFAETIDMNSEYQVFITSSSAQVYVTKEYDSFTVHGEAGASFDWMICSKQKNYSAVRMEQINISEKPKDEGEIEW